MTTYALIIDNEIVAVRRPGRVETKLADGHQVRPGTLGWTDALAAACGFFQAVDTPVPTTPTLTPTTARSRS